LSLWTNTVSMAGGTRYGIGTFRTSPDHTGPRHQAPERQHW
jgi:hypothetical protein